MKLKKSISDIKILVIGDIMLDKYVIGSVDRICPEAPVGVVKVIDEFSSLGGCGNVVNNISSVGANTICISKIGGDQAGNIIKYKLDDLKCEYNLAEDRYTPTIQKERIIANGFNTQMLRIDREVISNHFDDYIVDCLDKAIKTKPDVIIVSDYAKGVITKQVMDHLIDLDIMVIVDPKPVNAKLYKKVFMITPNNSEYDEMIKKITYPFEEDKTIVTKYILKTTGKSGMELYDNTMNPDMGFIINSNPVKVFNVTGAGDTVISTLSVCLALGIDVHTSAIISNACAGYVVSQPGTSVIPKEIFEDILSKHII